MEFFCLLLISSCLVICIHVLLDYASWLSRRTKLPPGPVGLPLIGNLLQISDRPHVSFTNLAKSHGPLMTLRLGFLTTVIVSSAEMAKQTLQKNDHAFAGRTVPDSVTGQAYHDHAMAWIPTGPLWRNLRKLCNTQLFTTQRLDALQGLRHQMAEVMVRHVHEVATSGEALNVGRLVFGTAVNLLSNTVFSVDMFDPKSESLQEFKNVVWGVMEHDGKPNVADYFSWLKPLDPQRIRHNAKIAYDRLHEIFDDFIDRRLQRRQSGLPSSGDFLDVLLDHSQENGADFTRKHIKTLLTDLFLGGTDTGSTTIEWAMAELLRHPNVMSKAKEELNETIGAGRNVEESDISRLPYLQAVVKETMRLHPVAPLLLPHRTQTDVEVSGYFIPKNTQILINVWAVSRDSDLWDNPTCFKPERFLEKVVDFRGGDLSLMPFGAGRRICPGLPLAVRMMHLMLASLLHHFDWKLPDGMNAEKMDMKDKFGVTLQMATPLLAVPMCTGIE